MERILAGRELAGALLPAAIGLLDHLVGEGRAIVTIIEGVGSDARSTQAIREWVEEQRPGVAVEVHRGDQPLYPYLFGVE
jgi:dihydroxyacetone kinase-like predicted kinase